jgi:hypothetical protein
LFILLILCGFERIANEGKQFTFMLALSSMDDFSEVPRTDRPVADQPTVAIDGIAFILLDWGAVAAGFTSESGAVHLRQVTVRMGALCFLRNFECQKRSIVRD